MVLGTSEVIQSTLKAGVVYICKVQRLTLIYAYRVTFIRYLPRKFDIRCLHGDTIPVNYFYPRQ